MFAKNLNISIWLFKFGNTLTFQGFKRDIIACFRLIGFRKESNKYFISVLNLGLNF